MATDLRAFLDRQVELIEAGDVDGLLDHYHEEAVLLRLDGAARGRAELRALFTRYLSPPPRVISIDGVAATDDTIHYQTTLAVGQARHRDYGAFVLRDGKIWRQIAGSFPPPDSPAAERT